MHLFGILNCNSHHHNVQCSVSENSFCCRIDISLFSLWTFMSSSSSSFSRGIIGGSGRGDIICCVCVSTTLYLIALCNKRYSPLHSDKLASFVPLLCSVKLALRCIQKVYCSIVCLHISINISWIFASHERIDFHFHEYSESSSKLTRVYFKSILIIRAA